MKRLYMGALFLCTVLGASAQEVVWQKDLQSSTQDFLSQVTTTIDQQYLITGSSIQSTKLQQNNKQNNGYDSIWKPDQPFQPMTWLIKMDMNKTTNAKLIKK